MTQVSSQNFKGFSPKIWGPSAWKFIHTIALSYPDNPTPFDKENYKAFFLSLQNVVPCARCREHYEKNIKDININNLNSKVLKEIPKEFDNYETILGTPFFVNHFKPMKFIKHGLRIFIKNPLLFFSEKKRNINFHFDLMHGENNLNNAISLLDAANQNDFRKFVNTEVSFNPHNMFICKSKRILKNYYEDLFPWLEKCEKLFGFKNLQGFGKIRIYTFLAERFMPYWFTKNSKSTTMPIIFYDIRKDLN